MSGIRRSWQVFWLSESRETQHCKHSIDIKLLLSFHGLKTLSFLQLISLALSLHLSAVLLLYNNESSGDMGA
jgi:hypothetical protein